MIKLKLFLKNIGWQIKEGIILTIVVWTIIVSFILLGDKSNLVSFNTISDKIDYIFKTERKNQNDKINIFLYEDSVPIDTLTKVVEKILALSPRIIGICSDFSLETKDSNSLIQLISKNKSKFVFRVNTNDSLGDFYFLSKHIDSLHFGEKDTYTTGGIARVQNFSTNECVSFAVKIVEKCEKDTQDFSENRIINYSHYFEPYISQTFLLKKRIENKIVLLGRVNEYADPVPLNRYVTVSEVEAYKIATILDDIDKQNSNLLWLFIVIAGSLILYALMVVIVFFAKKFNILFLIVYGLNIILFFVYKGLIPFIPLEFLLNKIYLLAYILLFPFVIGVYIFILRFSKWRKWDKKWKLLENCIKNSFWFNL